MGESKGGGTERGGGAEEQREMVILGKLMIKDLTLPGGGEEGRNEEATMKKWIWRSIAKRKKNTEGKTSPLIAVFSGVLMAKPLDRDGRIARGKITTILIRHLLKVMTTPERKIRPIRGVKVGTWR